MTAPKPRTHTTRKREEFREAAESLTRRQRGGRRQWTGEQFRQATGASARGGSRAAGIDLESLARVVSIVATIRGRYAALMQDARRDRGLTADQRAAALAALRHYQKQEEKAARKNAKEEARQTRAARRYKSPFEIHDAEKVAMYQGGRAYSTGGSRGGSPGNNHLFSFSR